MTTTWKPYRGTLAINWTGPSRRLQKSDYSDIRRIINSNAYDGRQLDTTRALITFHRIGGTLYISAVAK